MRNCSRTSRSGRGSEPDEPAGARRLHARRVREVGQGGSRYRRDGQLRRNVDEICRVVHRAVRFTGRLGARRLAAKPLRIVVPVTTGGPSDLVARILAKALRFARQAGDHREPARASMVIGSAFVAKADPDGYTLLQAAANLAINPYFMQDIPFDVVKDFAPVSLTHLTPYVFVVSAQSPVMSLRELIASIRHGTQTTFGRQAQEARSSSRPSCWRK